MSNASDLAAGVIGLGFGANHARVLSELPGVRLAAVCDQDEQRLAAVADGGTLSRYTDYETMLRKERLDAVVAAVPAGLHERVALAALDAGVAVLVEKPLAPDLDAARRIALVASKADVPLMAGHIERFNPAVQELAHRVHRGDIGRVLHLAARRMARIVVRTSQDVNVIHDSALHDIDAMRYVLGAEVEQVYAQAQSGVVMPFEDSLAATLRFAGDGDAGAIGSLEVNWLSPRLLRELVVLGEDGLFVLDYAAQTLELFERGAAAGAPASAQGWLAPARKTGTQIAIEPREPLKQELTAFVEAVRSRLPMPVTLEDALAAVAVADALTESARTGRPVTPARE
jgi:predicted dehydrogenase